MKQIAILLVAICSLFSTTGCEGGYDCALDNIAYNRVKFYYINEYGIEKEYSFPEPLTVSMMVNGRDSIVVYHMTNTKELDKLCSDAYQKKVAQGIYNAILEALEEGF